MPLAQVAPQERYSCGTTPSFLSQLLLREWPGRSNRHKWLSPVLEELDEETSDLANFHNLSGIFHLFFLALIDTPFELKVFDLCINWCELILELF